MHIEQFRQPDLAAAEQADLLAVATVALSESRTLSERDFLAAWLAVVWGEWDARPELFGIGASAVIAEVAGSLATGDWTAGATFGDFDFLFFSGFESRRFSRLGAMPVVAWTNHSSFRQKLTRSKTELSNEVITQ